MKGSKLSRIRILIMLCFCAGFHAADAVQWSFKTGGGVLTTPLLHDGVVFVGSEDGVFYALDAGTGTERWRFQSGSPIVSSAATDGSRVCFQSGNKLYGLDLNGALLWQTRLAQGPGQDRCDTWDISSSSPRIVDGVAYIGSEGGQVFGIRLANGGIAFHAQVEPRDNTVETTPTLANGRIYFGTASGVMYAYDLQTARKVWAYDTRVDRNYLPNWTNAIESEAVVWNGALYFGGRSTRLYSLNPETGVRNWVYHDGGDYWMRGGPVIADSVLYIGSSLQSCLHAFDPVTGALKWKQGVDFVIYGSPSVDGDCVFFGTSDETSGRETGSLYAVDRLTGKPVSRLRFDGQVFSTPVIENGTVYFGCMDGNVFALDRQAVLTHPMPNTGFRDKGRISLGDLAGDAEAFQLPVVVVNTGEGSDSVSVRLNAQAALTDGQALTLDPESFALAPGDSQVVTIGLNPLMINPGSYRVTLVLSSKCNMDSRSITKAIGFAVVPPAGVESGGPQPLRSFSLSQNFPNPFNPATTVEYTVDRDAFVSLKIYNLSGGEVAVLADGFREAGLYRATFEASGLTAGTYFCRYRAGGREIVRKMSLLK